MRVCRRSGRTPLPRVKFKVHIKAKRWCTIERTTHLSQSLFSLRSRFIAIYFESFLIPFSVIMKSSIISSIFGAALLAQQAIAHPGESHAEHLKDVQAREAYLSHINKRSLSHCADKLKARGNDKVMHARRSAKVESLRKKRSISQGTFDSLIT